MSNFETTINDIAAVFDGPHATPEKTNSGPYYLSISSLNKGRIDLSQSAFLSEDDYIKWTKRVKPQKGDLLFSYETRLGEAALMPDGIRACLGRRMGILRPKEGKVISEYLLYAYLSPKFQQTIISNTIRGATVDRISISELPKFSIRIPSIQEQKSIANLLMALDSKIELNNRINAELEAMAKTLYDYWFVQFDFPDANGKPYKTSGGKMVWNEELKREIPEGWEVQNLFNVCKVQYGFPFSTNYFNEDGNGLPVIRIRDILENSVSNFSNEKNIEDKYLIRKGDLLIGMDGNFHVNYWSVDGCYLNQRVVKLSETILPNIYLKYQIEPFIKLREQSVSRTTVGHLSDKDLKAIRIIVPTKPIIDSIKVLYKNNLNKIIQNKNENQTLTELRDWLLPMLMNGQVKVGDGDLESEELMMAADPMGEYGKVNS